MDQDERVSRLRRSQAVTYGGTADVVAYARQVGQPVEVIWPEVIWPEGATLADGSRLHVVIPDMTRCHWAANIRRFVLCSHSLAELVRLGTVTVQCARFLEASVVAGLNIVTAGATRPTRPPWSLVANCTTGFVR